MSSRTMETEVVWHNGGTGGYRTLVDTTPARAPGRRPVERGQPAGPDDIGRHLLNPTRPLLQGFPELRAAEAAH